MKKCITCTEEKEYSKFPKNKANKDGYRGDCKICYTKKNELRSFTEERKAQKRANYHKLGYIPKSTLKTIEKVRRYQLKYPEKKRASSTLSNNKLKAQIGNNLHHWSYNKEHYLDIIELTQNEHYKLHRYIKYDQSCFMYRDLEGNLLNTKEKHINYYNQIKNRL